MTQHSKALAIAHDVVRWLQPHVKRIEIAGSVRRNKHNPKDVEIVLIPGESWHAFTDTLIGNGGLFPEPLPADARGRVSADPEVPRWGKKYRRVLVDGVTVEMFIATQDTWGFQYWLRTGPGDANTYIMTVRKRLNMKWYVEGGVVYDLNGNPLSVPDERAMFNLMRMPFVEPSDRSEARYRHLLSAAPRTQLDLLANAATTPSKRRKRAPLTVAYVANENARKQHSARPVTYHGWHVLNGDVVPTTTTITPPAPCPFYRVYYRGGVEVMRLPVREIPNEKAA